MHAGFPCFTQDLHKILQLGANTDNTMKLLEKAGGRLMAGGIATALKLGFAYIMRDSLLSLEQSRTARSFFDNNFVFTNPNAPDGKEYYQGKFLIRTRKPGDDMNVLLRFCPNPEKLFVKTPFGTSLDSLAVVDTQVLDEDEAKQLETDPDQVDLVISFRDMDAMMDLIGRSDVDIVGLLLENIVLLKGNVGHLFKIGAIANDIEQILEKSHMSVH